MVDSLENSRSVQFQLDFFKGFAIILCNYSFFVLMGWLNQSYVELKHSFEDLYNLIFLSNYYQCKNTVIYRCIFFSRKCLLILTAEVIEVTTKTVSFWMKIHILQSILESSNFSNTDRDHIFCSKSRWFIYMLLCTSTISIDQKLFVCLLPWPIILLFYIILSSFTVKQISVLAFFA